MGEGERVWDLAQATNPRASSNQVKWVDKYSQSSEENVVEWLTQTQTLAQEEAH